MAELLANGTAEAGSADFTIAAGGSAILALKNAGGSPLSSGGTVLVQLKIGAVYFTVDQLSASKPTGRLDGDAANATTWRVYRNAGGPSTGVERA